MGGSCPAGWAAGPWGLLLSGAGEGGPLVSVGFGCVKVALREGRFWGRSFGETQTPVAASRPHGTPGPG